MRYKYVLVAAFVCLSLVLWIIFTQQSNHKQVSTIVNPKKIHLKQVIIDNDHDHNGTFAGSTTKPGYRVVVDKEGTLVIYPKRNVLVKKKVVRLSNWQLKELVTFLKNSKLSAYPKEVGSVMFDGDQLTTKTKVILDGKSKTVIFHGQADFTTELRKKIIEITPDYLHDLLVEY